jgi:hypothetical protein
MKNLIQLDHHRNMVVGLIVQLIPMIDLMFELDMLKMNSIEIMVALIKNLFNYNKQFFYNFYTKIKLLEFCLLENSLLFLSSDLPVRETSGPSKNLKRCLTNGFLGSGRLVIDCLDWNVIAAVSGWAGAQSNLASGAYSPHIIVQHPSIHWTPSLLDGQSRQFCALNFSSLIPSYFRFSSISTIFMCWNS